MALRVHQHLKDAEDMFDAESDHAQTPTIAKRNTGPSLPCTVSFILICLLNLLLAVFFVMNGRLCMQDRAIHPIIVPSSGSDLLKSSSPIPLYIANMLIKISATEMRSMVDEPRLWTTLLLAQETLRREVSYMLRTRNVPFASLLHGLRPEHFHKIFILTGPGRLCGGWCSWWWHGLSDEIGA